MTSSSVQLELRKGQLVAAGDQEYMVAHITGLDQVVARNLASGQLETVPMSQLRPVLPKMEKAPPKDRDLADVSHDDLATAKYRYETIKPLLKHRARGAAQAEGIAKKLEVSVTTVYRWRKAYLSTGLLSSLLPYHPDGGHRKSRLKDANKEEALTKAVHDYYLTDQKPSKKATHEHLKTLFGEGEKPPSMKTLRRRIAWREPRDVVAAREGERAASLQFDPNEGQITDANWPLAMVQVDHTLLPVMLVHEVTRRPICRPWVTFAIDVFSRVVPGMYLSLDHPSAMAAGMCISHSILPKEKWLADRGIDAQWPCWGVMGSLHMDNAKEFRGNMLRAACDDYRIDLHLRPVKKPHYGAHIERLMGTVSEELKKVPGATFSGPKEKGEYDAEGNAIMTLAELERWLVYMLAKYHHRIHNGIGTSPLQKYKEGLLGTKGKPGRGLPARRLDDEKVRIDFMPFEERTIQDYGVLWDVHYFSDVLRPWVNAPDLDNPRTKRQFRFRRDPRDISELYFFEPSVKRYFPIPYRDLSLPPISLWEFREAKRAAKKAGAKDVDERVVFGYVLKMRDEVAQSAEKTKSARRKHQKTLEHAKVRKNKKSELPKVSAMPKPKAPPPAVPGYDPSQVTPYDEED
ncbi:MAG: Mu transposase C-terminal domain-containing protein [Rhodocyclaceae bacterium]|nr:Mu transposase C-terminal domain-containing protein [Rhodocyclaceae bacterium]